MGSLTDPANAASQFQDLEQQTSAPAEDGSSSKGKSKLLVAINYGFLIVGSVSATLIFKFYFIHGGSSRWVSTMVQSGGFPLLLLLLVFLRFESSKRMMPFSTFTPKTWVLSIVVGVFLGINNLLFSWGTSFLPVSTASLLLSSQLAFNLLLSVVIVKQKITFSNLNCVILMTVSSVILALQSNHDKPANVTRDKYLIGFFSTLGAGLLFALYLPIMETIYRGVGSYSTMVEMQLVMEASATAFAVVGMAVGGGFSEMKKEAKMFDKGVLAYWLTIVGNLVMWQFCFMGTAGMVFLTTSLTGGVCTTALMAVNVLAGVIVYGDAFDGSKAVSMALSLWGFYSYLQGMQMETKRKKQPHDESGDDGRLQNP